MHKLPWPKVKAKSSQEGQLPRQQGLQKYWQCLAALNYSSPHYAVFTLAPPFLLHSLENPKEATQPFLPRLSLPSIPASETN